MFLSSNFRHKLDEKSDLILYKICIDQKDIKDQYLKKWGKNRKTTKLQTTSQISENWETQHSQFP